MIWQYKCFYIFEEITIIAIIKQFGYFLVNDLQTPPPPPSKWADGKIFLALVSDDFKTKKSKVKCYTNCRFFLVEGFFLHFS